MGFSAFLWAVLTAPGVRVFTMLISIAFAILYSLMVGIVFQLPYNLPSSFPTLSAQIIYEGPFMQVPWIIVYIYRRWVFSINPEALLALAVLTFLIGLNTAALIYIRRNSVCTISKNTGFSLMAIVPAFFSFFSCCGGGVAFSLLFSAGVGVSILGALLDYGRFFTALSTTLLAANLYVLYRRAVRK